MNEKSKATWIIITIILFTIILMIGNGIVAYKKISQENLKCTKLLDKECESAECAKNRVDAFNCNKEISSVYYLHITVTFIIGMIALGLMYLVNKTFKIKSTT